MYEKHNYDAKHIWNSNEIGIQVSRQLSVEVWQSEVHIKFITLYLGPKNG
jgi:hypothetical protein